MGASEERTPLNHPQQQPQQQPQQIPQPQQQYMQYAAPPVYPGYPAIYQSTNNVPQYAPYGMIPSGGYVVMQPAPQATLLRSSHSEKVGSDGSLVLGVVLGFFCPVISLFAFCCSRTLQIKRGVCLGHLIYYILVAAALTLFACIGSAYPGCNPNQCTSDVLTGSNTYYWGNLISQCQVNNTCPYVADIYNPGPQSVECAQCICNLPTIENQCEAQQDSYSTIWIGSIVCFLCAMVASMGARYYKRRIAEENLRSVYTL